MTLFDQDIINIKWIHQLVWPHSFEYLSDEFVARLWLALCTRTQDNEVTMFIAAASTWGVPLPVWRAGSGTSRAWWGLWVEPASLWPGFPAAGSWVRPLSSSPSPSLHPSSPSHPPGPPVNSDTAVFSWVFVSCPIILYMYVIKKSTHIKYGCLLLKIICENFCEKPNIITPYSLPVF